MRVMWSRCGSETRRSKIDNVFVKVISSFILNRSLSNTSKYAYLRNRSRGSSMILNDMPLVLKACAMPSMINFGKASHCEIIKYGVECGLIVGTSLVNLYGKCRDIRSARKMFDSMSHKNVITWNAMIGGYMKNGDVVSASLLFKGMEVEKTSVTWNEMIDGYAKNGDIVMARQLFDSLPDHLKNVVSWTVMVDGYASNGDMDAAMDVFESMKNRNFYVWSVIIGGYFKKGDVVKAKEIFDRMNLRNLVNWNSLISGYSQNGMYQESLDAFREMHVDGFEPDEITAASILSACAQSGMLDVGKEVHEMILQKGMHLNPFILNGLVDMYAKCGDLNNARLIFERMSTKNSAVWNSIICGFAINGKCREAIELFHKMEESVAKPDTITFLSVLSACAHGGFVEEGMHVFSKIQKHGLTADIKHYGCLVDLLGRAGKLQEAFELVKDMPIEPNDIVLGALLGACRIHGDTLMAEYLLEFVGKLNDSCDDGHYVLLSNIYAASERWEMAQRIRLVGSEKKPGCSAFMS